MGRIAEKTFEINITRELLDFSKTMTIDLLESQGNLNVRVRNVLKGLLKTGVYFGVGLTQQEEAIEGYDVVIQNGDERVLFLQYKSGVLKQWSKKSKSKFSKLKQPIIEKRKHFAFGINNDSKFEQHGNLRDLTERSEVASLSVMYVFPRMTTQAEMIGFIRKGGIWKGSSFVPVLDVDQQAIDQNEPIIQDGVKHRYRTSRDGTVSELNYYYYYYKYSPIHVVELISELVQIHLERLYKLLAAKNVEFEFWPQVDFTDWRDLSSENQHVSDEDLSRFVQHHAAQFSYKVVRSVELGEGLPEAPSTYTSKLKDLGNLKDENSFSYQIF